MTAKDAVMTLVKDVGTKGFGNENTAIMEYHAILGSEIGTAMKYGFTPLGICMVSILEPLEKLRVVDRKSSESRNRRGRRDLRFNIGIKTRDMVGLPPDRFFLKTFTSDSFKSSRFKNNLKENQKSDLGGFYMNVL
jgi:hypothetical protein